MVEVLMIIGMFEGHMKDTDNQENSRISSS